MTRPPLPSTSTVYAAIDQHREETGRSPSALAIATRLGLANTTFRRNFPDIITELAAATAATAGTAPAADAYTDLRKDNARLRRANQEHTEHLELAIATIQRLSIDNERLRAALDNARNITHLGPRPAQTPHH